jgi:hypothetical protein
MVQALEIETPASENRPVRLGLANLAAHVPAGVKDPETTLNSSGQGRSQGVRLTGVLGRIPEHCEVMARGTGHNKQMPD